MKLWILSILLALPLLECEGAQILAVLPFPSESHQRFFRPILRQLVNRGHNVTVIVTTPAENANYKQIVLENLFNKILLDSKMNFFDMRKSNWIQVMLSAIDFTNKIMIPVLNSTEIQQILHCNKLKFDLILVESTFYQEAYVAFGHKFGAPVIELQTIPATFWLNHVTSNPYMLSYSVDYRLALTDKMNFWERLQNTVVGLSCVALLRYVNLPKHQALVDEYMRYPGWETRPPLIELLSNISLVILSTHVAMHYPHPNNPNVIEVGGTQISPPKQIPEELQSYMDSANEGFIYFSFGSNAQSSMMPENTKQALISAFKKLSYKVLWKWETDFLPNKPSNVEISKWFPQTNILAHKNIKGFISHGGINSLTEAVYFGVPLVVVPLFGDQFKNAKQAEVVGYGLTLDIDNITEESVIWAVNEVTKPSYKQAALKQSAILTDNPLPPLDTVMYWIEYVIRHQGAAHLRTAAASLSWYQYFLLDVFAVLTGALAILLLTVYLLLKAVFMFLCRGKKEKRTVKMLKKTN